MTIVEVGCAWKNCGYSPFPMNKQYNERARRTGEGFLCPAGHSNVYNAGLTADQKRVEELERRVQWLEEDNQYLREIRERLAVSCQWIDCGFVAKSQLGLHSHMHGKHGMPSWTSLSVAS